MRKNNNQPNLSPECEQKARVGRIPQTVDLSSDQSLEEGPGRAGTTRHGGNKG